MLGSAARSSSPATTRRKSHLSRPKLPGNAAAKPQDTDSRDSSSGPRCSSSWLWPPPLAAGQQLPHVVSAPRAEGKASSFHLVESQGSSLAEDKCEHDWREFDRFFTPGCELKLVCESPEKCDLVMEGINVGFTLGEQTQEKGKSPSLVITVRSAPPQAGVNRPGVHCVRVHCRNVGVHTRGDDGSGRR